MAGRALITSNECCVTVNSTEQLVYGSSPRPLFPTGGVRARLHNRVVTLHRLSGSCYNDSLVVHT